MHRITGYLIGLAFVLGSLLSAQAADNVRKITLKEYKDKMKGGWIGQMAGVGWGGPTEFRWQGDIVPEDQMPKWEPNLINQFGQDDIYVEMTFMRSLEQYGLDVSIRQAGIDFANSGYDLWHANKAGRDNLRNGIAPPDSGHPKFNTHADDIDYQIEADYSGLIAPGLPNVAIELGEKFGRLMNYGDGLYGGQFVGGMYAEAFFERDPLKIVEAGLKCIPADSLYAQTIRDVIAWYKEDSNDWVKTWKKVEAKYQDDPSNRKFSCGGAKDKFNIDAKINGAYIVIGLLFGKGDIDQTIIIATRCGQDSDCNPSNAGGVLGTAIGFSNLPDKFKSALDESQHFSHTAYNFATLTKVSEDLVRQAVKKYGGKIEKDASGDEVFVLPIQEPKPSKLEQCWEPGPCADSKFTEAEMKQISFKTFNDKMQEELNRCFPGWTIQNCYEDMSPGLREELQGKKNVFVTHPPREGACVLSREIDLAKNVAHLALTVGHHPDGDWTLIVKADGKELLKKNVGKETAPNGWMDVELSLKEFVGQKVKLELLNQASGWAFEAGYWAKIEIK